MPITSTKSMAGVLPLAAAVLAAAATICGAHVQVEPPCMDLTYNMMVPKSCERCCLNEGYKSSFYSNQKCRCLVPTDERRVQERKLQDSVNEYVCKQFSGPSHTKTAEGKPLESACDQCCHRNSFRTYSFRVDHSFAAPVGASQGTGRGGLGHSQCLCVGLRLKFVAPAVAAMLAGQ